MTDPARPDPATRDLSEYLVSLEAILRGFGAIGPDEFLVVTTKSDAATPVPPPLPDEPPDGTVLAGTGPNAWVRDDSSGANSEPLSRWWMTAKRKAHTWAEALQHGADPGRRLVELPDPDDDKAVHDLSTALYSATFAPLGGAAAATVRKILRALADRGNQ